MERHARRMKSDTKNRDSSRFTRNNVPGTVVVPDKDTHNGKRCEDCFTAVEEVTGICSDGDSYTGAGDWGQRRCIRRVERCGVASGEGAACAESLHGAAFPVSVAFISRLSRSEEHTSE